MNNEGIVKGINDADNILKRLSNEEIILRKISENPSITAEGLSIEIGKTVRTVKRILKSLIQAKAITRIGGNKNGHWKIIEAKENANNKS